VRRLLSESANYTKDLGRSALRAWHGFFFTPTDPTALGLIRVVVGMLLFWDVAVLGLDLREYLGSDGWIGPEAVRQFLAERAPWAWSFWLWVPDGWLSLAWAGCLVVLALFTLGLGSRVTAVLAWAIAISTVRRVPVALFGFDLMITSWTLYVAAFGASGQALSLDRFISRYRALRRDVGPGRGVSRGPEGLTGVPTATVSANLSLRLIQLHLVLVYGSSGLSKLMGPEWWNGTAMEMIILTPEFRRFDLVWLAAYPVLLNLATHAGLLLELSYPVLIWVRKLRPLLLVAVVQLHLGIDLLLGLTEFGLAMIAANLAFVSGPWLRGLVTGARQPAGHLLYRGDSPRCRSLVALALAADPDGVIQAVDTRTAAASALPPGLSPRDLRAPLLLVGADGRTASGPDALLLAARWLPMFWPLGLLGRLPGVAFLLRRALRAFLNDAGGKGNDRAAAPRPSHPAAAEASPTTRELVAEPR
jgi:Vitamin K-dependent gamma-carboxylase